MKRVKKVLFAAAAVLMAATFASGCASCSKDKEEGSGEIPSSVHTISYPTDVKVGYSAEILSTIPRQRPQVSNGGLSAYPVYGTELYAKGEDVNIPEKTALLAENDLLRSGSELPTDGKYRDKFRLDGQGREFLSERTADGQKAL